MTKKELIDRGYIDQYVLGLTTEDENTEVERLANLYPEIQHLINTARHRICSSFNRNLTQPALRSSLLTKRRVMLWSALVVSFFSIGFCFLCREHFSLQENYTAQCEKLEQEREKVIQLASFSRLVTEQSDFIQAPETNRIKLKGVNTYPEAEVMVFQSENTGKMMLRVIELPPLPEGQNYEVWAHQPEKGNFRIGQLFPPVRYDSLYTLAPVINCTSLEITTTDPKTLDEIPVCLASLGN